MASRDVKGESIVYESSSGEFYFATTLYDKSTSATIDPDLVCFHRVTVASVSTNTCYYLSSTSLTFGGFSVTEDSGDYYI